MSQVHQFIFRIAPEIIEELQKLADMISDASEQIEEDFRLKMECWKHYVLSEFFTDPSSTPHKLVPLGPDEDPEYAYYERQVYYSYRNSSATSQLQSRLDSIPLILDKLRQEREDRERLLAIQEQERQAAAALKDAKRQVAAALRATKNKLSQEYRHMYHPSQKEIYFESDYTVCDCLDKDFIESLRTFEPLDYIPNNPHYFF